MDVHELSNSWTKMLHLVSNIVWKIHFFGKQNTFKSFWKILFLQKVMDKIVFSSLIAFNGMSKDYLDRLHKEPNISTKF